MKTPTKTITQKLKTSLATATVLLLAATLLFSAGVATKAHADSWPGLNGKILFSSDRAHTGQYEIYTMNADGSDVTQLTSDANLAHSNQDPRWSPDGTKIVFRSNRDGNDEIYTMNADGSNQKRVTYNIGYDVVHPSFSPDGSKIVFALRPTSNGHFDIYTVNINDTGLTQLTNRGSLGAQSAAPEYSPDGTKICFQSTNLSNGAGNVFVMNADGSNQQNLINSANTENGCNWSADGSKILYQSSAAPGSSSNYRVWSMNADGSNKTDITTDTIGNNFNPSLSSDGQKLIFYSTRDGNDEIYTARADGSQEQRLTNNPANDTGPVTFQPLTIKPQLGTDQVGVSPGRSTTVNVLANDSSVYSAIDPASVKITSAPTRGTASVNSSGEITYTAKKSAAGQDRLTYQACAIINPGLCNSATLTIKFPPAAPGAPDTGYGIANSNKPLIYGAAAIVAGGALTILAYRSRKSY
ncbi:MAG: DUF5050 domain-containing protein [Candidatus Saccharimonadales bacterium]